MRVALAAAWIFSVGCTSNPIVDGETGIALAKIPGGRFQMGSSPAERGRGADERLHEVSLSRGLYLGVYEVTQAQWQRVMGGNPSHHVGCAPCPVEQVTFHDVGQFLAKLNVSAKQFRYRLPTEAEWEYVCRAGTTTAFATGPSITTDQANFNGAFPYDGVPGRDRGATTPVGTFAPNAWGVYDMHGNVWEWTADWYAPYSPDPVSDPQGPREGERRVIRGGSWYFDANSARCALRYNHAPVDRGFSLGFRVAADRR
jgi:sulfatase modifying factor 1